MQRGGRKIQASFAISPGRWLRSLAVLAALAAAIFTWAEDADARDDGLGARGARTVTAAPAMSTGASRAMALDRTSPVQAGRSSYPGGSLGGLFNRRGLIGGFAAGFLGAGLLGLLFGHGLLGELGGAASFLGLLFQLALVALLGRLIWTWWNRRNAPAFAALSPRQLADAYESSRNEALPSVDDIAIPDASAADDQAQPPPRRHGATASARREHQ